MASRDPDRMRPAAWYQSTAVGVPGPELAASRRLRRGRGTGTAWSAGVSRAGRRPAAAPRRPRRPGAAGRRRAAARPRRARRRAGRAGRAGRCPPSRPRRRGRRRRGQPEHARAAPAPGAPARSRAANGPAVHSWMNLCRFSARTPSSRPSTSAEAAEVASGTSRRPPCAERVRKGAHRGRLPGPGGPDPGQQQPRVAGERGHQFALPGVQAVPAAASNPSSAAATEGPDEPAGGRRPGGVHQPGFGVKDSLAGVPGGGVLR